ncbi:MAG: B12-binding domain-containing radical SAM protein [Candidatus Omnitrophota bacterium]
MNVYLSMAFTTDMDRGTPPHCLLVLAAVLEAAGHRVKLIFPIELDAFLQSPNPLGNCDVFGLSANSFNWFSTQQFIQKIHELNPTLPIILGGCHPTKLAEHCLEVSSAQIVVRGEGEITIVEVLQALESNTPLSTIQGITYKDTNGLIHTNDDRPLLTEDQLDQLPIPAYHLVPPHVYDYAPVETSRGCLFHCIFCGIPFARPLRRSSSRRVTRILQRISELRVFRRNAIFLTDDSFSAFQDHAVGMLELIRRINPKLLIGCEARISEIETHHLIPHLERSNIFMIQIGVECGYPEGLKRIKKGVTIPQALAFAHQCKSTSFKRQLYWSFIIGFPWETETHILQTIHFAFAVSALCQSQPPQVNNFAPYPGTDLVKNYETYGYKKIPPEHYDRADWYQPFLGETKISPVNRDFLRHYLTQRFNLYPNVSMPPFLRFPDGQLFKTS